jgi:hypothetical protein
MGTNRRKSFLMINFFKIWIDVPNSLKWLSVLKGWKVDFQPQCIWNHFNSLFDFVCCFCISKKENVMWFERNTRESNQILWSTCITQCLTLTLKRKIQTKIWLVKRKIKTSRWSNLKKDFPHNRSNKTRYWLYRSSSFSITSEKFDAFFSITVKFLNHLSVKYRQMMLQGWGFLKRESKQIYTHNFIYTLTLIPHTLILSKNISF